LEDLDININNNVHGYIEVGTSKNGLYSRVRVVLRQGIEYTVSFSKARYEANWKDCLAKKNNDLAIKVCMEITGTTTIRSWSTDFYRFKFN
jgi:hypothetical protein